MDSFVSGISHCSFLLLRSTGKWCFAITSLGMGFDESALCASYLHSNWANTYFGIFRKLAAPLKKLWTSTNHLLRGWPVCLSKKVLRLQHKSPQWQTQYFRHGLDFEVGAVNTSDMMYFVLLLASEVEVGGPGVTEPSGERWVCLWREKDLKEKWFCSGTEKGAPFSGLALYWFWISNLKRWDTS